MTYTLFSRRRKNDGLAKHDSYKDLEVAREFADELVGYHRHYEALVRDSSDNEVYKIKRKTIKWSKP